jgi:hypothetical protein
VLTRLQAYEPREVEVDGLVYREGLNAVHIRAASPATSFRIGAW